MQFSLFLFFNMKHKKRCFQNALYFEAVASYIMIDSTVYFLLPAVLFIFIYSLIFLFVYAQLWFIWLLCHKRASYQSAFLFASLLLASIRIILFTLLATDIESVASFPFFLYFLLFHVPVLLQYGVICLLVLYYGQVILKMCSSFL